MLKVGLTGNYYSGHNEVADIFEENGMPVFDADLILKFLLNYSPKHIKEIKNKFGESIYNLCLLDMRKFNTNIQFNRLIDVVEIDIIRAYEKWRMKNANMAYTIFKSSILFERNLTDHMNFKISVFRPQEKRRDDIVKQLEMPILKVNEILDNEMSELVKNTKSDYVIHNYGSYYTDLNGHGLRDQIEGIHKSLIKKSFLSEDRNDFGTLRNILN